MKRKIIDKIGMILISITIIIFSVIIGANEKGLRILPIGILLLLNIIFLIIKKIVSKEEIVIKNKLDICVLVFILSTTLPLVFKTYCSFQGTIEFIIKYFYVYSFYLLVRNIVKEKSQIDSISLVTIASSLIIIVLGLDMLWKDGECFKWIIKKMNLLYKETEETKGYFSSTFGYKNTTAVYLSFCIFLAINQIQTSKNKFIKVISVIYMILSIYIIYLTGSRAVIILTIFFIVLYFILFYKETIKQNKKKFIKLLIGLILIFAIILMIVINILAKISKNYEFNDKEYLKTLNYNFKPNTEYKLNVELESENNTFEISLIEMNEYYAETKIANRKIENSGNIEIKFKTTDKLLRVDFKIKNPSKEKIKLKKFYINEEECVQHFKYIPNSLGKILKLGVRTDPSIIQRKDFWKDSIKIFKEHPIIGQGGNTWRKLSKCVEEYPYAVKETHSYFLELLIEYGIIGIGLFTLLISVFIINYIKKYKKVNLSIFIGLMLVLIHSLLFDFNMSFMLIQILFFGYMGAIVHDSIKEDNKYKKNIIDILTIIGLSAILVILIISNIAKYIIKDKEMKKNIGFYKASYKYEYILICNAHDKEENEVIKELQYLMNKEPYYMQTIAYTIYWEQITKGIDKFSEEELNEYIKYVNEKYENIKFESPMYVESILSRVEPMSNGYLKLLERKYTNENLIKQINRLKNIIISEHEVYIEKIKDTEKNGVSIEKAEKIINQYNEIIDNVILLKENSK